MKRRWQNIIAVLSFKNEHTVLFSPLTFPTLFLPFPHTPYPTISLPILTHPLLSRGSVCARLKAKLLFQELDSLVARDVRNGRLNAIIAERID
jgi:hypothetical protein